MPGKDQFSVARRMAFAEPTPVGWSSMGDHPMSHDKPLTERQWLFLLHCGVIRTDKEIKAADKRERVVRCPVKCPDVSRAN